MDTQCRISGEDMLATIGFIYQVTAEVLCGAYGIYRTILSFQGLGCERGHLQETE